MKLIVKNGKSTWVPDAVVNAMKANVDHAENNAHEETSPEVSEHDSPADDPEEAFRCPHCGKEYVSEAALKKHITSKHSTDTE